MTKAQVYSRIKIALCNIYQQLTMEDFRTPMQAGLYPENDEPVDSPWGFVIRVAEVDYWVYLNEELQFSEQEFEEKHIRIVCDRMSNNMDTNSSFEFYSISTLMNYLIAQIG